jgi:hypothetical protein
VDECKPLVAGYGGGQRAVAHRQGRAVQVDPIKPTLESTGCKRLKLKCDEPLSNFAFNFSLRRYTKGEKRGLADTNLVGSWMRVQAGWLLRTNTPPTLSILLALLVKPLKAR